MKLEGVKWQRLVSDGFVGWLVEDRRVGCLQELDITLHTLGGGIGLLQFLLHFCYPVRVPNYISFDTNS